MATGSYDPDKMVKECCEKIDKQLTTIAESISRIGAVIAGVDDEPQQITRKQVYPTSAEIKLDPSTGKPVIDSDKKFVIEVMFRNESKKTVKCEDITVYFEDVRAKDEDANVECVFERELSFGVGEKSHKFKFAEPLLAQLSDLLFAQLCVDMTIVQPARIPAEKEIKTPQPTQSTIVKIPETATLNDLTLADLEGYLERKRLDGVLGEPEI